MKFFISSDIEGVAGITHRNETGYEPSQYLPFAQQMSLETAAACEAILDTGDHEVIVRDAHGSGRNMFFEPFPEDVKFIREWSGDPLSMMDGIDSSYDACLFVGYHSAASEEGNPLSHTINSSVFYKITINNHIASEFLLNSYTAASFGVPVIFVSGDKHLTESAQRLVPGISTVATLEGKGAASLSLHPAKSVKLIYQVVTATMQKTLPKAIDLPQDFHCQIEFLNQKQCKKASYYPGVIPKSSTVLEFNSHNWYEVIRLIKFAQ